MKSFLFDESPLNVASQETLFNEIDVVFTEEDNLAMTAPPTMEEVYKVVKQANHSDVQGTDGIPSYLYFKCFDSLGESLTAVIKEIHQGSSPTQSQRTSMMVLADKPKKAGSKLVNDKRSLSQSNTNFKTLTGRETDCHNKVIDHILCTIEIS